MKRFAISTQLLLAIAPALGGLALVMTLLLTLAKPAAPARADPGVLYVAPHGDCSGASPCYGSVQAAVDAASEGDVIKIAAGIYTDVSTRAGVTQVVYLTKTVTIRGGYTAANWAISDPKANPTTLDAQRQGRVLYACSCAPTIEGLNITGGYVYAVSGMPFGNQVSECYSGGGAGVELLSSPATLIGNAIYGNTAGGRYGNSGGGVFLDSAATLINNTIYGNRVTSEDPYSVDGGGGVYLGGSALLVGNIIRNNSAPAGGGINDGADFYFSSDATLIGNTIVRNTASHGGGVFLGVRGISLINNIIADNQSEFDGSGIYIWGGDYRFLNNTVARNTGGDGSGVFVNSFGAHVGDVTLINTIIANQTVGVAVTAPSRAALDGILWFGNGRNIAGPGKIAVNHAVTGDPAFVDPGNGDYHIRATSAAVNQGLPVDYPVDIDGQYRFLAAPPDVGADEVVLASPPPCRAQLNESSPVYSTLQAALVASSSVSDVVRASGICEDQAIWNGEATVVVLTKTLTLRGGYNSDFSVWDPVAYPTILNAHWQNRVIAIGESASPTVEYLTLFAGQATEGGGLWSAGNRANLRHLTALYNFAASGGGLALRGADARLEASRLAGNQAELGGGVYITGVTATLSGNTFQDNRATNGGGAYLAASMSALERNVWSGNYAASDGGGIFLSASPALLAENTFTANRASFGGGLYLESSAAMLDRNTVSGNVTVKRGGGLYLHDSPATLDHNVIVSNTTHRTGENPEDGGGGAHLDGSSAILNGNVINGNVSDGTGGGLVIVGQYLQDIHPVLMSNTISSNSASRSGGGLFIEFASATFSGNTVTANAVWTGGGGGMALWSSTSTLIGNAVSGNAASESGGGLDVISSVAMLSGNILSGNSVENRDWPYTTGGGLSLRASTATLNANIIRGNRADYGGGLDLRESDATLVNEAVLDNWANSAGSGLFVQGAFPRLLHTTVARNSGGDGSGICVTREQWNAIPNFSAIVLTDTILVSHTVGITVSANNTATLDGVLWYGNGVNTSGAGVITVTHAITGDPAFAADGFHLTPNSTAFDAGVDAGVTTDIDGDHRPQGAAPDLGADEIIAAYASPSVETTLTYTDSQGLTTTIRIPVGAVTQTTLLAFAPVQTIPSLGGFAFANHAFDLASYQNGHQLPSLAFNLPATVTIRYSDPDVRVVTDENRLFLGWWTGSDWSDVTDVCGLSGTAAIEAYRRDPINNVLGAPICHLSRFALFGPTRQVYLPLMTRGHKATIQSAR